MLEWTGAQAFAWQRGTNHEPAILKGHSTVQMNFNLQAPFLCSGQGPPRLYKMATRVHRFHDERVDIRITSTMTLFSSALVQACFSPLARTDYSANYV